MEQMTIQIDSISDVKREIDNAQRKACISIVEIGYILRKADDAGIYREMGCSSIFEFAKQEYGWDQSRTSRFMSINKTYSAGGYSCVLEERYKGFGQAKLVEMLQLPEEIREEISPEMKREEIREIKKEYAMAEETREEENFTRAFAPAQYGEGLLMMAVRQILNMPPYAPRLRDIWKFMLQRESGEPVNEQDVLMALQPSGRGHIRAGSCYCFLREDEFAVMRGKEKEVYTYTDVVDAFVHLSDTVELSSPDEWYIKLFGKQLPGEEKAEETGEEETEVKEKAAEPGVNVVKKAAEKVVEKAAGKPEETEKKPETQEADTALPGQKEIGEYADKMPISYENLPDEKVKAPAEYKETEKAAETEEKNENSETDHFLETDHFVIPDIVDGVCQYCNGNKDIQTNEGGFTIHIVPNGLARVEKNGGKDGYGIAEFDCCPKCGKRLG